MQEKQVTIGDKTFKLSEPFLVMATQNPIEQEGTYALPEAQLDRFLFKIKVNYPDLEDEIQILKSQNERTGSQAEAINSVLSPEQLQEYREQTRKILVEEKILNYIAHLTVKSLMHTHLYLGGTPRASLSIMNAAKAFAAISGRDFVTPEDVKRSVTPVLRHRVILSPEREMEGMTPETVIDMLVQSVEVPR